MNSAYDHSRLVEGSWQECWGVKFKWTSQHLTPQQLHPLIYTYDKVATEAVERLDDMLASQPTNSPSEDESLDEAANPNPKKKNNPQWHLYELIQEHASKDERIGKLWTEVNTVPEWVDWDQIERGQKIFFRYGGAAISTLTYLSLLGGMGGARTVETLGRTGGFDVKVVRRRLLETVQHTLNVHRDLKSIQPGGDGFVNSVRVRLLHAAVRRRITQIAAAKPSYYDTASYGIPINDLDSMGTISVFSAAPIWLGLPRQGIRLREREISDYLALWRYVAYVMGAPHAWLATAASARSTMESLAVSEIRPSAASADLANNIITGLAGQPPTYASRGFMCAQAYWLNGTALAEKLEIDPPSLYYSSLVLGQCIFFMAMAYVNRTFSWLDERHINVVRKIFYTVLLEDKSKGALGYESKFLFKYLPEFGKMSTERGVATARTGVTKPGIERTALLSLITFSVVAGVCVWYSYKVFNAILGTR